MKLTHTINKLMRAYVKYYMLKLRLKLVKKGME